MKNSKSVFALLLTALVMSACAQKDSEFAAKYAKNGMGADVVDGSQAQEAGEAAASAGVKADIIDIKKVTISGLHKVTATLLVNDQQVSVTTSHYSNASYSTSPVAEGSVEIAGLKVAFHAVCANASCEPYYASMEAYKDRSMQIQVGVRKFFDAADKNRYQWLTPANAKRLVLGSSLTATDLTSPSVMVGFLNKDEIKKASGSSYVK